MSDYKLVPVEPTPEMVSAAEDAYMPFGDMELALRMAILAAPDVQGEPVGEAGSLHGAKGFTSVVFESRKVPVGTKLYATPQPATEQQLDATQLVEALTMARETIAAALRANAPDYFTTDADIARHVVIQRIDTALAAHRRETKT